MSFMKRSVLIVALALVSSSAFAAGVASRAYTCDGLHGLVVANRFVFINYPSFMDFVVPMAPIVRPEKCLDCAAYPRATTPSAS
jgi:hypothetical protein